MNNSDNADLLAAEYVMGLASEDEAVTAERLIRQDTHFAARVQYWRDRFSVLDDTAPPQQPGRDLWSKIEASLAAPSGKPARMSSTDWSVWWTSLGFWRSAGLAAAFASLLLAIALGSVLRVQAQKPVMIAVLLTDANRPAAVVHVLANGEAALLPLNSIDVPAGRALQVWTLWDRARGPVSVGLSKSSQTIQLNLGNLPKTSPEQLFEISLEPESGSPTGRPTGPILMKGTASTPL